MVVLLIHCEALCINCREERVSCDAGDFRPLSAEDSGRSIGNGDRAMALAASLKNLGMVHCFRFYGRGDKIFFRAAAYSALAGLTLSAA